MKVAIIIPTYNERENISRLLTKLLKLKAGESTFIVVDDNSPDGTAEVVRRFAQKYPAVKLISRPGKLGLGSAYKAGFRLARKLGAEAMLTMDADLSHDPKYIAPMLAMLKTYDVVIGSRLMRGGRIVGFSAWRMLLSKSAQNICKYFLGMHIEDSSSGFRVYKTRVLNAIKPDAIKSEGYSFIIEAGFRSVKKGFKIGEIPITFNVRTRGYSKISQTEILKALLTVFRLKFS